MKKPLEFNGLEKIRVGATAQYRFVVTDDAMDAFRQMSGDNSLIHCDAAYCSERGFSGPIVYGALMVMKLSYMVGVLLPGRFGLSVNYTITFHNPLYVGEEAILTLEITSISKGTGIVDGRYTIISGDQRVAQGKTQSIVPCQLIDETGKP